MTSVPGSGTLWLAPRPVSLAEGDVGVALDPGWTPGADAPHPAFTPIRITVDEVLHEIDPIAETSALLDAWAAGSGVVERLTIGGTSFWYYVRLRHWQWLQERVIWALVLRRLLDVHEPARVACAAGVDAALRDVAALLTAADGLELVDADPGAGPEIATAADGRGATTQGARGASIAGRAVRRIRRVIEAGSRHPARGPDAAWMADLEARLDRLAAEPGRPLLVISTHHPHLVDTREGPRLVNPYLGSVADRLRGSPLDPIVVDWHAKRSDPESLARIAGPGQERVLPQDVVRLRDEPADPGAAERAARVARDIAEVRVAVPVAGIDLGPLLAADVSATAARWLPGKHLSVARCTRLLRRLAPAGLLVADEYHRQDWMEAARVVGVPVAAIQHGTINRHHQGYVHPSRPAELALPARTYLFGRWERDRLVDDSVYRDDEVVVAGSPRLDAARAVTVDHPAIRAAVRAELGVADADRLIVLSGTWGRIYRRFHYPVVLARLFDRPLPGIHLCVKLHPAEEDEGPYRAVVEGVAEAGGFAPVPITVVRDVDLYRLLAAADAHLGVHSTVLTEAVFVGTPNLLATAVRGGDLLDYVASGVALPVATGVDIAAALDAAAAGAITEAARRAFLDAHYEPGAASDRIAADLLAWLA